ncbi:arylsulfate sulfotransferase [Candidatus Magnetomoraceae bacterium gMMP-1]
MNIIVRESFKLSTIIFSCIILCFFVSSVSVNAFPTIYPTGTTIYNPERCFNGYTIYITKFGNILLVDMEGRIVHSWNYDEMGLVASVYDLAEPLSNGNIMIIAKKTEYGINGLVEIDWNGNIVWEYFDDKNRTPHHDFQRLESGNTLILYHENKFVPEISAKVLRTDYIVEVDSDEQIVWEWHTDEHFDGFGFSDEAKQLIDEGDDSETNDWAHTNSIQTLPDSPLSNQDSRFQKGNILVSQRNTNIIFIIDKKSGRIVWKTGPDDNLTIGQHDAQMIPQGFPGAGNILVFDNGGIAGYPNQSRLYSRVVEIEPLEKKIVWEYNAKRSHMGQWTFFSPLISGAQRLLNGNTLICEGMQGRFFEITEYGKIVWEYINPVVTFDDEFNIKLNRVYRAMRVDFDWAQMDILK